jgi:hypothetical protein
MTNGRRAVFVGIARNCAVHLADVLRNIDSLSSSYDEAAFVFVVSDSTDDTASRHRWSIRMRLVAFLRR